ncbi:sensor domain-containing diguanylate cyclase [Vibrio proteolyticus]|uniref:diguanylate cyclase n=1 Tax=Vibrio proteolyticus NBRC 13287 TaxID=1219065 RepID=U2ZNN8_VIBPR|nr:sensor domain-containing diguanylate cyclase [Vibrio proteolyticus]GAD69361.1 hypothetical protein VPR01S_28_00160 [Vibrio proteolyticus NBRC 13287]
MKYTKIAAYLLVTCFVFAVIVSAYYYHRYLTLQHNVVEKTAQDALNQLTYSEREYDTLKGQLRSTVKLLANSQSMFDYAILPNTEHRQVLENIWESVATSQKWYKQIRYISRAGKELIDVGYTRNPGHSFVRNALQNKASRDYFKYAQSLEAGEVALWGIDLETHDGELVVPYTPGLRLISPVTVLGKRMGYLVLNVDVSYLFSRMNYSPDSDFNPELLNQQGYYLSSDNKSKLFGHILSERQQYNVANLFPAVWQKMQQQPYGYAREQGGIIAFRRIELVPGNSMYLMAHVDRQQILQRHARDFDDLLQEAIFVLMMVLFFALPIASVGLHYHRRNIESQLARAALSGMSAVMISDAHHSVIMTNDAFTKLTGRTQKQVQGRNALKVLFGEKRLESMLKIVDRVGQERRWEGEVEFDINDQPGPVTAIMRVQAVLSENGKISYYITSLVDISDRKALEFQLRELSEKDELTKLWNRRKFENELKRHALMVERYPERNRVCLALIDIDHFKRINDHKGHDEGDRVIRAVAEVMTDTLRQTDFIARIGGEEFAVIMPHTTLEEAESALNRLRIAVELDARINTTISAGFTDLTHDNTRCYKWADVALYDAKASGRNQVAYCLSSEEVA